MRKNNKQCTSGTRNGNRKSNKNMSNKDIAKALKERDNGSTSESYNDKSDVRGSGKFNDPEWYVNSTQILNDAARLPYSIPVGTCFTRDARIQPNTTGASLPQYDNSIPGIFASYLMPTLGSTDQTASSAVNVAANSLFQFIRSKISGTRHYEAVDVMIYMGAMDSLYCMITWLTRLYATVFTYHQANKYLSRALIEAQNVDYDDLIDHLPQFRTAVNVELAKVRAMYLPSVLPIFKRHSWMFSHYFIEGESEKDQIYFHTPAGYHFFRLDDDGKGALEAVCVCHNTTKFTTAYLLQMIRQMINPIFEREDFNIISGDMLKAYEGNVFTLTEIPDIATISLTYSSEVLLQFKNAKYKNIPNESSQNPNAWKAGFFNYFQNGTHHLTMFGNSVAKSALLYSMWLAASNDNALGGPNDDQSSPYLTNVTQWEWSKDTLLTTPSHDVTPVENMINSRLTVAFSFVADSSVSSGYAFDQLYFGSEWPVFYRLFTYHRNKVSGSITLFSRTYDRVLLIKDERLKYWIDSQEPIRSAFKYLPEISLVQYDTNDNALHIEYPGRSVFEVDNYAVISPETVAGLHNAAILGEYNIPNLSVGR